MLELYAGEKEKTLKGKEAANQQRWRRKEPTPSQGTGSGEKSTLCRLGENDRQFDGHLRKKKKTGFCSLGRKKEERALTPSAF